MAQTLISANEARTLARPVGRMADDKVLRFVEEVENLHVFPRLGYELMSNLHDKALEEPYKTLLEGGEWVDRCGHKHRTEGVKKAEAYFTYAKIVMYGDFESTRYGMVSKDGDYSTHISAQERSACYSESLSIAQTYLAGCVAYARDKGLLANDRAGASTATGGVKITKIG